jgi:signal transduction histidine kinase
MASRAKLVGGQLAVVSQPSGGTRITLEIPTRRRADAA